MKPLNSKQRKTAIINFILLYLLGVLLLAVPIFATFKLPEKQCAINKTAVAKYKKKYRKCVDEKRALTSKSNISANKKADLQEILDDYSSVYKDIDINAHKIDNLVLSPDEWDKTKIENVEIASDNLLKLNASFRDENNRFAKFLKTFK